MSAAGRARDAAPGQDRALSMWSFRAAQPELRDAADVWPEMIGTVQRELWEVVHFDEVVEAERARGHGVLRRLQSGIEGYVSGRDSLGACAAARHWRLPRPLRRGAPSRTARGVTARLAR